VDWVSIWLKFFSLFQRHLIQKISDFVSIPGMKNMPNGPDHGVNPPYPGLEDGVTVGFLDTLEAFAYMGLKIQKKN
jgi:hypothetical protein